MNGEGERGLKGESVVVPGETLQRMISYHWTFAALVFHSTKTAVRWPRRSSNAANASAYRNPHYNSLISGSRRSRLSTNPAFLLSGVATMVLGLRLVPL